MVSKYLTADPTAVAGKNLPEVPWDQISVIAFY